MSDEKQIRLNRAKQDVADRTGKSMAELDVLFANGEPAGVLFAVMYEQNEGIRQQQVDGENRAIAAERRKDIADLRAQQYFVRLRDAGLLKEGETY